MQKAVINIFLGLLDLENYFKWSGKREEGFMILATRERLKLYFNGVTISEVMNILITR